jgi:hypothetical protein
VGAIASLLAATPGVESVAQAHEACVNHGDDTACTRFTNGDSHFWLDACDRESDGHRVRAWADAATFSGQRPGNWDPNGANSGCANDVLAVGSALWWVCEEVDGCSAHRNH